MSCVQRHRPETPCLTHDRWLTAQPAVLAKKRTRPDRSTSRPMDDGPAARLHPYLAYAIPAALIRPRLIGNAVSTRFRPFSFARYRALSAAFSTSSVSEFCFAEVATPMLTVTESGAGTFSCAS